MPNQFELLQVFKKYPENKMGTKELEAIIGTKLYCIPKKLNKLTDCGYLLRTTVIRKGYPRVIWQLNPNKPAVVKAPMRKKEAAYRIKEAECKVYLQ